MSLSQCNRYSQSGTQLVTVSQLRNIETASYGTWGEAQKNEGTLKKTSRSRGKVGKTERASADGRINETATEPKYIVTRPGSNSECSRALQNFLVRKTILAHQNCFHLNKKISYANSYHRHRALSAHHPCTISHLNTQPKRKDKENRFFSFFGIPACLGFRTQRTRC